MSQEEPRFPQSEKTEKEISSEIRGHMWETLRMVALAGLLTFGSAKTGEQVFEYTHQKPTESTQTVLDNQQQTSKEERFKSDFGREMTEDERKLLKVWDNDFAGMEPQERDSIMITGRQDKGIRIEDGKIIQEAVIVMKDGKTYETRAETDAGDSSLVDSETGNLKVGELSEEVGVRWNTAFVSRVEKDGSGLKVVYEATTDGLKMTIQELGPEGNVLSQRISLIQEKPSS